MSDRADEVAADHVRVLANDGGTWGIDVRGAWFPCDDDTKDDVEAIAQDVRVALAAALRAYAEEASGHWKREADTGAMTLAAIHAGLGLTAQAKGGISAQDVLDRVGRLVEEARRGERHETAGWYVEMFCPQMGIPGDEKHARGDCEHCNMATAILARMG